MPCSLPGGGVLEDREVELGGMVASLAEEVAGSGGEI